MKQTDLRKVWPMTSILIVGCGALGGALAVRLSRYGEITILDPSPRVRVKAYVAHEVDALKDRFFDGIIVATKCYDLEKSIMSLKNHVFVRRILFLQNGIFNLAPMRRSFPQADIVRGVTTSAIGVSFRRSIFHYQGEFFLAPEGNQKNEAVGWFGRMLAAAGLKTSLVSKSSRIVWAKLIFSAVMNPLPLITGQGYDILKKDEKIWKLVRQAVEEGRAVAKALGIRLAFDPLRLIYRVRDGDLSGIPHRGSIFQDVSAGRPTELDFTTGALVREARKAGVKIPTLRSILVQARMAGA